MTVTLERIRDDFGRITSDNVDPGGGVNRWSPWKGSVMILEALPLKMLILEGVDQWSPWKGSVNDFGRITSDNVDPGG